jgi:hypothetical protein
MLRLFITDSDTFSLTIDLRIKNYHRLMWYRWDIARIFQCAYNFTFFVSSFHGIGEWLEILKIVISIFIWRTQKTPKFLLKNYNLLSFSYDPASSFIKRFSLITRHLQHNQAHPRLISFGFYLGSIIWLRPRHGGYNSQHHTQPK